MIHLITLIAFLPLAVGCSSQKTRTLFLDSDPDSASVIPDSDKPVRIIGYSLRADGFHEWDGFVQAAPPDYLLFSREEVEADALIVAGSTFHLLRADVLSLRVHKPEHGRTAIGIVLVLGAIAVVVAAFVTVTSEPWL